MKAAKSSTGAGAYHARLDREKIESLEANVKELEARLDGWISPLQQSTKIKEAVTSTYAIAHKDGYLAGWSDKACGVAPHQYPTPQSTQ